MTISSEEVTLQAQKLLLSGRKIFVDNHLAQFPINRHQQGTFGLK